jgi:SAM-dependent methyltransferase
MSDEGGLDYYEFELKFRGSLAEIKNRLRVHVDRFAGRQNVLDLGCGRGEFLELMAEAGIAARGVDIDSKMVEACAARGLNAVQGDVIAYLSGLEDESVEGIFGAHLVEHLSPTLQRRLIDLCRRKLKPGGPVVFETPNPLSLAALPSQLTLDPTHEKLVHPQLLQFMLTSAGFDRVELVPLQLWPPGALLERIDAGAGPAQPAWMQALNRNFARLNQLLYGAQDYAAVGWKGEVRPGPRRRTHSRTRRSRS